jgi:hypothetical protein
MTRRFARLAPAVLIAVVLAACSSGSKWSTSKSHVKADAARSTATTVPGAAICKMFDVKGVNAFFNATSKVQYSDVHKCVLRSSDKAAVTISLWKDQTRDMYDQYKDARIDSEPVAKVGDAADYSEQDEVVQFLKGNKVVTVELDGDKADASAVKPFLIEQARYAAGRV